MKHLKTFFGSEYTEIVFPCPACKHKFTADALIYFDPTIRPDLKPLYLNGDFMKFKCPHCKTITTREHISLYFDPDNKFIVAAIPKALLHYSDKYFRSQFGNFPEYTPDFRKRVVFKLSDYFELIRIFEYGLDDRAIHLMKFFAKADAEIKQKDAHVKVTFSGMGSNLSSPKYAFKVVDGDKELSIEYSQHHYEYCKSIVREYISAYFEKDWLTVDDYFSGKFLDIALENFQEKENSSRLEKSNALRKQLSDLSRKSNPILSALINVSNLYLDNTLLVFEFKYQVLCEKMNRYQNDVPSIAERVIGFKPEISICHKPKAIKV